MRDLAATGLFRTCPTPGHGPGVSLLSRQQFWVMHELFGEVDSCRRNVAVGQGTGVVAACPLQVSTARLVHPSSRLRLRVANESCDGNIRPDTDEHMHVVCENRLGENVYPISRGGVDDGLSDDLHVSCMNRSFTPRGVPGDVREQTEGSVHILG